MTGKTHLIMSKRTSDLHLALGRAARQLAHDAQDLYSVTTDLPRERADLDDLAIVVEQARRTLQWIEDTRNALKEGK